MRFSPVSPKYLANSYTALVLARIVHSIHLQSLVNTGLQPGGWSLDIPHANGVRAHQPRATPWETSLQWHRPPWKGGGSFRGLRPFRAPECSGGGAGFPRELPWADMLARFQRVLLREWARSENVQAPGTGLQPGGICRERETAVSTAFPGEPQTVETVLNAQRRSRAGLKPGLKPVCPFNVPLRFRSNPEGWKKVARGRREARPLVTRPKTPAPRRGATPPHSSTPAGCGGASARGHRGFRCSTPGYHLSSLRDEDERAPAARFPNCQCGRQVHCHKSQARGLLASPKGAVVHVPRHEIAVANPLQRNSEPRLNMKARITTYDNYENQTHIYENPVHDAP